MSSAFRIAPAVVLLAASTAVAGLETVPVTFSITTTTDLFGDFTIESDFDATFDGSLLSFASDAGSFESSSSFDFTYTDLSMGLDGEFIDGTFTLIGTAGPATASADLTLSGFGSAWDGSSASGTGIIEMTNIGFTPETVDIHWSINLVPAPGAIALLGVAGLARRRRRD